MTPEQFALIESIFSEACELPPPDRAAFLERRCAGDQLVRSEVDSMLAADDEGDDSGDLSAVAWPRARDITQFDPAGADLRPLSIPERIGRYRILRECGHGGMGVVYEAEQESPHRRVALKVIRTGAVSSQLQRRFRHEVEILGQLQHPGIAQVFEAGGFDEGEGGQPYFAMEFVDGIGLLEYAGKHALDTKARLALFARVCDAAHYAHEKGVIHRDLKPDNILVVDSTPSRHGSGALGGRTRPAKTGTDDGLDSGQPKILDFGVARMTDPDVLMTTMATGVGQLIGTIQYMSPEQTSGDSGEVGIRSDVYALGVVLFEMLGGRLPYDLQGRSIPQSVRIIQEEEPNHLSSIDRAFSGDIDTIVSKCLEKEAVHRYRSATELAEDIRRHLLDEPISARPPSSWHQLSKFSRRNRALVVGVIATVASLAVGVVASINFALRAHENAELASENATRALGSEAAALRRAYVSNLTAATALAGTDPLRAKKQLEAAPEALRGWEWRYLSSQLERHTRTYEADDDSKGLFDSLKSRANVAFTADGSLLVSAFEDGRVAVWDPVSAELMRVGTALVGSEIRALELPESGPPLVACGTTDGKVRLWDLEQDRWLDIYTDEGPIWYLAWDSIGERLLIETSTSIWLWQEGRRIREHRHDHGQPLGYGFGDNPSWDPPYYQPTNLAFTKNGSQFLGLTQAEGSFSIRTWDVETGELLDRGGEGDHAGFIGNDHVFLNTGALSHDGTRVANCRGMRASEVKDVATFETQLVLRGHTHHVRAIAWTTDDQRILTSSHDGTVRMWDAATGVALDALEADISSPLAIAQDGSGVVYRAGGIPRFWDFGAGSTIINPDTSFVNNLAYSPDGTRLAASSIYSGNVTLFDSITGRNLRTVDTGDLSEPAHLMRGALVFSPDGDRLCTPQTIDVTTGAVIPTTTEVLIEEWPLADRRGVRCRPGNAVSPDGTLLATASVWRAPRNAVVRDIATGAIVLEIEGPFWGVAFSPDGARLAASREFPGTVEIWNLARKEQIVELPAHGSHAYCVDFHPDGKRLASGGNDNAVRLWDTTTWEPMLELRGHTSYVKALTFSPDGTQLASGSGDLTVRIWDTIPRAERHRQSIAEGRR